MGKRRNTAKTGDLAIYRSKASRSSDRELGSDRHDDEYMHLQSDELSVASEGENDGINVGQNVMDLGIGGNSESSDDEGSSGISGAEYNQVDTTQRVDDDTQDGDTSASESESEPGVPSDPRSWGRKKSSYYHGDTGDIEIGQDEEDAFDEEEAAKEVETSRFQVMEEGDFMLPDDHDENPSLQRGGVATARDVTKLSQKKTDHLVKKQHPELLPLASFLSESCRELRNVTQVATDALVGNYDAVESVQASIEGQQYLLTKALIGNSTALNTAMYLLLKTDVASGYETTDGSGQNTSIIRTHPVMVRLEKCTSLMGKCRQLSGEVGTLDDQIDYLVRASSMLRDQTLGVSQTRSYDAVEAPPGENQIHEDTSVSESSLRLRNEDGPSERISSLKQGDDVLLNEARFGLRVKEINISSTTRKAKRSKNDDTYFGDVDKTLEVKNSNVLAATVNAIQQRSNKKRPPKQVEEIDETRSDGEVAEGLRMMEEELGKFSSDDDNDTAVHGYDHEDPGDSIGSNLSYYEAVASRAKEKKLTKRKRYEVAPKFPRIDEEVSGERAISRAIMKNRGLVAHKAKINRNPRVKKREQYRKALIRRKGAVRDIRTNESHKYGGEETGIKSSVSRSRKF